MKHPSDPLEYISHHHMRRKSFHSDAEDHIIIPFLACHEDGIVAQMLLFVLSRTLQLFQIFVCSIP